MYQELTEALLDSQEQQKSLRKRIKEYNPYKIPPDFELAKQHGIARRVCLPHRFTTFKNNPNALRCPCCELPFENQEIKLSCSLERLSHLGVCFPLYFIYIKFCFIVLGICLLSAGIVNLTYDLMGTNCEQIADSFICKISFLNVLSGSQLDGVENLKRQSLVNIISIFLMIIVFELFRNYQRKFVLRHTHKYSISDFSLLLSFMPKNYRKEDVEDFVNFHLEKMGEPQAKVVKIYFLHQLGEYAKLYSDKRDLLAKAKQGPNGPDLNNPGVQTINSKLREIERLYNLNPITCNNGRVIVVFENIRPVRKLRAYFRKRIIYNFATYIYHYTGFSLLNDNHLYEGHYIKVSKAPEPSDIQWENLSAPSKLKAIRRVTTLIVASILIVIGFTSLFLLKKKLKSLEQMTSTSDIGEYVSIVVSLVGALFVAITNTILGIFIRKFARYEKHKTHTSYFVTVGKRITAALVLNMIVTTTLANVFHSSKLHNWNSFFELSVTGLFYDVFFLFITNSYMSSIFNYFDFVWGFKLYRRHKALQDGTSSKLTQREAHSLFEGHPVDMALRFANVNKTLIFTGFFIPYIPLGLVFSMIGFAIVYWIDKYLLLRRYVCAHKLSFSLPKAMLITGEWFIIAYALGNHFTFFLPLTDNGVLKSRGAWGDWYFWISFVTLFAALAYKFVVPKYFLHKLIIKFDDSKQDIDLETIIERLPEDYDNFHPVCRRQKFKASETLGMTIEEQDDEILVRGPTRRSSIASGSEDQSDSSNSPIIELNDVQDFKSDAETGHTAKNRRSRRQ